MVMFILETVKSIRMVRSKASKRKGNLKKLFIAISIIVIVVVFLAVGILLSISSSTKMKKHLQKIFEIDREFTDSLDQIQLIFDSISSNELSSKTALNKLLEDLSKLNIHLDSARKQISMLESEIEKFRTVEECSEYSEFLDSIENAYNEFSKCIENIKKLSMNLHQLGKYLQAYLDVANSLEKVENYEESLMLYLSAYNLEKASDTVSKIEENLKSFDTALLKANKIINFSFNQKLKEFSKHYANYLSELKKAIALGKIGKEEEASIHVQKALNYHAEILASVPTETELNDELDAWINSNLAYYAEQADSYFMKGERLYEEAINYIPDTDFDFEPNIKILSVSSTINTLGFPI